MRLALWALFLAGYAWYRLTGRTPELSYRAMRRLYARTDGRFNDACLALARRLRPAPATQPVSGVLGDWGPADVARVVDALDRDGLAVFDRMLPEPACAALEAFARGTPARPMGIDAKELYRVEQARALRYDFDEADVLRSPEACRLCFDGTFAAVAAAYFRCRPVFDFVTMWWTTARGAQDYSAAAQMFHFDMDRLFFLKFFVYLTDVTPETGPHVFVAGSHRRKPPAFAAERRFGDAEVTAAYPAEAIRTVCGRRGTVFAADTRALHKGLPVVRGDRLVLQVEFAISRFGQNYESASVSWSQLQAFGLRREPDRRVYPNVQPGTARR